MDDREAEEVTERIARGLCDSFNVKPTDIIRASDRDPRFSAYVGDNYMSWARDQVQLHLTIMGLTIDERSIRKPPRR